MSDHSLVLDGVTVRYGETTALDDVSMSVEPGEIVAVVGPSGSGKSTLLRAVAGLEVLAAGRILLANSDLANVPTHQRGVGLMFQDNALFPHLNVMDNVAYGLVHGRSAGSTPSRNRPRRADRAIKARVAEVLELVGLGSFGERSVQALSGGEAQRVALARALAPEPSLLMLDEPLGSLDRSLREQLTADLRLLLGELGQTALHVTHDQGEAFALADRVAVLIEGSLRSLARPEDLWRYPDSVAVAEFLGHRNIWPVEVHRREGSTVVVWNGVVLGRRESDLPEGRYHAIVPERALSPTADSSESALDVIVDRVAFGRDGFTVLGHLDRRTEGAGSSDELLDDEVPAVWFVSDARPRIGERLHLSLKVDRLHLLPA